MSESDSVVMTPEEVSMTDLSTPDNFLEDESLEDEENPLKIDEPSFPEITEGEEPLAEQMVLDRLPRPVHELNCRQARTYLVKLLRNANGGQNPHYGDPEMKPPFWPDYYWPWIKLTDVHTKPRGMNEPLQYSEMMKLAISRGYQYFGYDPCTYVDAGIEEAIKNPTSCSNGSSTQNPAHRENNPPPRLVKPLSQLNCNNPVYGSPDTRPPWWPDDCIRWVDMVDLRGRPPYLPNSKTYTDVLKIAIERAYKYYGYDPETHIEGKNQEESKCTEEEIERVMDEKSDLLSLPNAPGAKHIKVMGAPPKLPIPVAKLNCGGARSCLSRLLRYRSGHQPPNYGNPQFMPSWWPNDIIEWSQIKNLSHRYEGYLGNSYSNCLRIAIIRGYAYYGYDANTYVEDLNGGSSAVYWTLGDPQNMTASTLPKITCIRSEGKSKKPMPNLLLIENTNSTNENKMSLRPVPLKVRFKRKTHPLMNFLHEDYLNNKRYTDVLLVSSTGQRFKMHKLILILFSSKMKSILLENPDQVYTIILPDISSEVLKLLIHAFYVGEVVLENEKIKSEVLKAKEFLSEYGLLQNFECSMVTSNKIDLKLRDSSYMTQSPALSVENSDIENVDGDEEETNFEISANDKEINDAEINFDDIIEAVATKIEEEEKAVTSLNKRLPNNERVNKLIGIRRSVRQRRKKDMSDFELGGSSDVDSPTSPIIKEEPVDHEDEDIHQQITLIDDEHCDLLAISSPPIKIENIEDQRQSSISLTTRRSTRNINKRNHSSEPCESQISSKQGCSPVSIPIKRCRSSSSSSSESVANKPRIEEIDIEKLDSIIKEGGPKALCTLLMKSGFLGEKPPKCSSCGDHASLITDNDNVDGLVWRCPNEGHPDISVRKHSIFEDSSENLCWIMKIIVCWSDNTSLNQCHQLFGADIDKIFQWYDKYPEFYLDQHEDTPKERTISHNSLGDKNINSILQKGAHFLQNLAATVIKDPEAADLMVPGTSYKAISKFIISDDVHGLREFLDTSHVNIEDRDEDGSTLLHFAASKGNKDIVSVLLNHSADVQAEDFQKCNPLHVAAREGHNDVVHELIDAGSFINQIDMGMWTPFMWACYYGRTDTASVLIDCGCEINVRGQQQVSPLNWAAGRGHENIVRLLLEKNMIVDLGDKYGTTALIWAARKGYMEIVRLLLRHGANVDAVGMYSWTPLLVATAGNFIQVVDLILEKNPNVNKVDKDGLTALAIACKEGYTEIAFKLISFGAYINLQDKYGDTNLMYAAKGGHKSIVDALLKKHADINMRGKDNRTCLHCAIDKGHTSIVKSILNVNPDLELRTIDGDTALLRAVKCRNEDIVQMLLDKKAKLSATDTKQDTVLHIAMRARSKAIVEILLRNPKHSQLLYRPNRSGETPYTIDINSNKSILGQVFGARKLNTNEDGENMLGYDLYSSSLADILTEPSLSMPITVGLYAKWGSGKSFLLASSLGNTSGLVGLIVALSTIVLSYIFILIIRQGSYKFNWLSFNITIASKFNSLKLILQVMFCHPPGQEFINSVIEVQPLRLLFTEQTKVITSAGGQNSVTPMIDGKKFCCIPYIVIYFICFFLILAGVVLIMIELMYTNNSVQMNFNSPKIFDHPVASTKSAFELKDDDEMEDDENEKKMIERRIDLFELDIEEEFTTEKIIVGLLIFMAIMLLIIIVGNFYNIVRGIHALIFSQRQHFHRTVSKVDLVKSEGYLQAVKGEVQLLQEMVKGLDAFTGQQSRMVVVVDGLDSCEQGKVLSVLDAMHMLFSDRGSPFIIILAIDPHVITKAIELNLNRAFIDTSIGLRKVKVAQKVANKLKSMYGSSVLIEEVQGDRRTSVESVASSLGSRVLATPGEPSDLTKILLSDDYFSDVNPRSLKRLMNVIYVMGRLLKAFHIDFNWHRLSSWVNITEQWPYHASWITIFVELNEDHLDDLTPLKSIYNIIKEFGSFGCQDFFCLLQLIWTPYLRKIIKDEIHNMEEMGIEVPTLEGSSNVAPSSTPAPTLTRRQATELIPFPSYPIYTTPISRYSAPTASGQNSNTQPGKFYDIYHRPLEEKSQSLIQLPSDLTEQNLSQQSTEEICEWTGKFLRNVVLALRNHEKKNKIVKFSLEDSTDHVQLLKNRQEPPITPIPTQQKKVHHQDKFEKQVTLEDAMISGLLSTLNEDAQEDVLSEEISSFKGSMGQLSHLNLSPSIGSMNGVEVEYNKVNPPPHRSLHCLLQNLRHTMDIEKGSRPRNLSGIPSWASQGDVPVMVSVPTTPITDDLQPNLHLDISLDNSRNLSGSSIMRTKIVDDTDPYSWLSSTAPTSPSYKRKVNEGLKERKSSFLESLGHRFSIGSSMNQVLQSHINDPLSSPEQLTVSKRPSFSNSRGPHIQQIFSSQTESQDHILTAVLPDGKNLTMPSDHKA
ncbi:KIDINS220 [Lepeophtheirus salmonis]|uniref:KIDINS220 n=1 Tax=Lepeophtheirus salmonis TaxID=72036 RepID=A0A7R8HCH7_LEPSM|nr:KIDINS220 [Lepeophtheirus salmonis]CAF3002554.1 KIDINS220 [Lepeophtheirus salmonis]